MKALELLEKTLKKCSTQQLVQKLEKFNTGTNEYNICVQLLARRGQDVSKYATVEEQEAPTSETTQESISPTLDELKEQVDQFVDELIATKQTDTYTEVMKALGGDYESDLDDLFEVVTVEQLLIALEFKNVPIQVKEEAVPEVKKEKIKKEKSTISKESPRVGSKAEKVFNYLKENPTASKGEVVKKLGICYAIVERVKKTYLK